MGEGWQNRIIGEGEEAPDQLLANPANFRLHPKHQQEALAGVLDEVGWVQRVIVNQRTGHLIDGHLRVMLAMRAGMPKVPVEYVDLSEKEEKLILSTFDLLSAQAEVDTGKLDALLRDVSTANAAVQEMLAKAAEAAGLYLEKEAGGGGDEFDATLDDGPMRTMLGDLWQLGPHRLLVGDCTVRENVERLMGGERADMVFTDPPYGVAYIGKTKDALVIQNDNLGDRGTQQLVADILAVAPLKAGGVFYVCSPPGNTETAFRLAIREVGLELRQCLVWVKQHFVMGRQDYHWRHESILYGWKDGAAHYFADDRTQDTVWECDRPMRNADHPTMKPVELVERAVSNSSLAAGIVYDACGGGGSTLIACERLNRKCRMMEIEPKYADVILRRYEAETGEEAVLLERLEEAVRAA